MELLIAVVGIIGTLSATIITQVLTSSREKRRLKLENEKLALEIKKFEIEHPPQTMRIEFEIDCQFYGPIDDEYITEFIMSINNKGYKRIELSDIFLRVRGIKENERFESFDDDHRLSFPHPMVKASVISEKYNYYFVEPGVQQPIKYITPIPRGFKYILAHARFMYDEDTPHTTERMFEIP